MKIYLSDLFHPDAVEWLEEHAEVVRDFDKIEELDAILIRPGGVTGEQIRKAKNLKLIGRHGVGYNTVDIEAAKAAGVHVLNVPRGNAHSVAEYVVTLVLATSRRLYEANHGMREGRFNRVAPPDLQGRDVEGSVFGVIGMGNIGMMAAGILHRAFNVKAIGYDPFVDKEEASRRGFTKVDTVEELIEMSDYVSINVPLTEGTRNLISGNMFDHFKPDAVLINTARGGIINEKDLYDALVQGKIRAAACDVFESEPDYAGNRLFELDNFSATPHLGGNTVDSIRRTSMALVQAAVEYLNGTELSELKDVGVIC